MQPWFWFSTFNAAVFTAYGLYIIFYIARKGGGPDTVADVILPGFMLMCIAVLLGPVATAVMAFCGVIATVYWVGRHTKGAKPIAGDELRKT